MRQSKNTRLNCFSPPVMLATLAIEFSLAIYALWRYKMTPTVRLIALMLVFLGIFQLAEFNVCQGSDALAIPWSRIGFVAITALPPLGLHIMHKLAGKPTGRLVHTAYLIMGVFMAFFLLAPAVFTGHQCTGNYVIFQFTESVTGIYSVYYFGWLLMGIGLGFKWAKGLKAKGKSALRQLQSVQALILGYFIFLVPSAIAMTVKPEVRRGIPSVLCGFAIFLALILALYILPRSGQLKLDKNT